MQSLSGDRVKSPLFQLQPPKIFHCPGFYVLFAFEDVETFHADAEWTDVIRTIERSTIPPIFDNEAASKLKEPLSIHLRGFFAIKSNEQILDLKRRIIHEIRHSSKARRWWRRHMGNPIPLYAQSAPQKIKHVANDRNRQIAILDQEIVDNTANDLQQLEYKLSKLYRMTSAKDATQHQFQKFPLKKNEIENMIPQPQEPDISDLESTSYCSSDYNEEINIENENAEMNQQQSIKIKKRRYNKKDKQIQYNNEYKPETCNRRTPRIQPEDFVCYSCLIKPPQNELSGTNIRSQSISQLRPVTEPSYPYKERKSVVQTELFPAFSPFAATYELPPPPEIDPQFSIILNNNNNSSSSSSSSSSSHIINMENQHQHSFPPLKSLASQNYSQFRSHQQPQEFSMYVGIEDRFNTLIQGPIHCKDNEKSFEMLKQLYPNENLLNENNCIDKWQGINPDIFQSDNRIPLLIFCVPGKVHVFDIPRNKNNENQTNQSNQNEDDIDLKGEMCIVMTQGRQLVSQIVVPREMPFVNVMRLLSTSMLPSYDSYYRDTSDIVAHDGKGKRILNIKRNQNNEETQFQLDPVYQPEDQLNEQDQNNERIIRERRIKRRNDMKEKFQNLYNSEYKEQLRPYTSVWEVWCDQNKRSVGGRVLRKNRRINHLYGQSQLQPTVDNNNLNREEQKLFLLEQERYNRLSRIAEWEGTGSGIGSGGAMLQTSIHMSVAHAGENIELLEQSKKKIVEQIKKQLQ
ncbi:MAG: hypothetical protein EZS28_018774 [Streblomastix strix]|uniref:Uncharacterized protein n=1 Tax=Streblomastix strix TaxID=222440 RepID=A0A5J4VSV7_9EUKA|nr:MAG: hypothetical protein EZS28_018774 [Streblomastix strix]